MVGEAGTGSFVAPRSIEGADVTIRSAMRGDASSVDRPGTRRGHVDAR